MEDIPQPANDPYSVGDHVQIYLASDDPDNQYHDIVCEIVEIHEDSLGKETGRNTDTYSYTLCDAESGEELPISFRHHDLVPVGSRQ
jgi:hypothetical protein